MGETMSDDEQAEIVPTDGGNHQFRLARDVENLITERSDMEILKKYGHAPALIAQIWFLESGATLVMTTIIDGKAGAEVQDAIRAGSRRMKDELLRIKDPEIYAGVQSQAIERLIGEKPR